MLICDKVALFDFCETIADFLTADRFVQFVQFNSKPTNRHIRVLYVVLNKSRILGVLRRVFPKASISKRLVLLQLKGRTYDELALLAQQYYETVIKQHFISPVVSELLRLQQEGYKCYLVSGGYDIYLRYFCEEYNIDGLLCTKIRFSNGICDGKFDGADCMFENKVQMIKSEISGDSSSWYAFSDSKTDLPMLEIVGNPLVISRVKSQNWAEIKKYKQIIW